MTSESTTSPVAARSPGWRQTLTDPAVVSVAVYAVLSLACAAAAYFLIFTNFALYDDEGTLLVTLQAFARGHTLYRDIYSPYGPFYYELFGGLFALTGKAVTTDASRSIVIVLWTATSLLYGIAVQKLSGRLAMGAAAMIAAFASLFVLANEPMHPQGLCVLLLALITLLAVYAPTRRPAWSGAAIGAVAAALVLTKLNLGAYAVAAGVLAAVLTVEPLRRRRWILFPVVALVVVAMPLYVVARDLNIGWVRNMVAVQVLSLGAIAIAGWPLGATKRDEGLNRWILAAVAGFVVAAVAIMVAILATGPSLSDIYEGMVTEALRVRDVNMSEFPMNPAVVDWGIAAVAAAALTVRLRDPQPGPPALWPGVARALAGMAIWLTVMKIAPVALNPSSGNPVSLPMVLAWVAAIPPAGAEEGAFKRFLRLLLPTLAVAESLQVYPVAGSQMWIASMTFVPVGALCLTDALTSLRSWSAARGGRDLERFGIVAMVALTAIAVDFGVDAIARPGAEAAQTYRDEPGLPFPGASALHLPEEQVQAYEAMVDALHEHHCTTFIGYPNVNSIYLWSGLEPPAPDAPGVWLEALDDKHQQRVVDELRKQKRPCAIRSESRAGIWLGGRTVPNRPLVRYVFDDFRPVLTAGEFEFMIPKSSATEGS